MSWGAFRPPISKGIVKSFRMPPRISLTKLLRYNQLRRTERSYIKAQLRRSIFEPTPTIGMLQIIGGFATIAAYSTTDQLKLRCLFAVGGITGSILPNLYRKPRLIIPVFWSVIFLTINGARIYELMMERKPITFNDEDLKIYEQTFYGFLTPAQFDKLMKIGVVQEFQPGFELKKEGQPSQDLILILEGAVDLQKLGSSVSTINTLDGQFKFIGIPRKLNAGGDGEELDTDHKMVQVKTISSVKALTFPLADLKQLLESNPAMTTGLLQLFHERLLQKVLVRDKSLAVKRYAAMISLAIKEAAAAGSDVHQDVKNGLKKFRREQNITKLEHKEALAAVGWSSLDWKLGKKEGGDEGAVDSGGLRSLMKLFKSTKYVEKQHYQQQMMKHSKAAAAPVSRARNVKFEVKEEKIAIPMKEEKIPFPQIPGEKIRPEEKIQSKKMQNVIESAVHKWKLYKRKRLAKKIDGGKATHLKKAVHNFNSNRGSSLSVSSPSWDDGSKPVGTRQRSGALSRASFFYERNGKTYHSSNENLADLAPRESFFYERNQRTYHPSNEDMAQFAASIGRQRRSMKQDDFRELNKENEKEPKLNEERGGAKKPTLVTMFDPIASKKSREVEEKGASVKAQSRYRAYSL